MDGTNLACRRKVSQFSSQATAQHIRISFDNFQINPLFTGIEVRKPWSMCICTVHTNLPSYPVKAILQLIRDVDVLPVFPLLLFCCWGKVVERRASVSLKVVVSEVLNVTRSNAQILEGLGVLVNLLVDELPVDIRSIDDGPPEDLVEELCNRLQNGSRHIDMPSLLEDLAVDHLSNLLRRVFVGAVELICLSSCGVIISDDLKSFANINRLVAVSIDIIWLRRRLPTWTGEYVSCMLLDVNKLAGVASLINRLSSKPKMGAGRTMVVSGKMLLATCSPLPLVAKNSDSESGSAL